jgi:hypothetical protein
MGQNQTDYLATAIARDEPAIIDQDMTRADIVATLERLKLRGTTRTLVVQMDGPVRDLLVSALRRKA